MTLFIRRHRCWVSNDQNWQQKRVSGFLIMKIHDENLSTTCQMKLRQSGSFSLSANSSSEKNFQRMMNKLAKFFAEFKAELMKCQ